MNERALLPGYSMQLCRRCPSCGNDVAVERETGEQFNYLEDCPWCTEQIKELAEEYAEEARSADAAEAPVRGRWSAKTDPARLTASKISRVEHRRFGQVRR